MEHVRNGQNHIKGTFSGSDTTSESVILQQTKQVAWWGMHVNFWLGNSLRSLYSLFALSK
jgi:hypothetical protein